MKLKLYEIIILSVTALSVTFCAGFFIGRGSGGREVAVSVQSSAVSEESPSGEQAPVSGEGGRVNINTAGVRELASLPGIGAALAERIVEYRQENGDFGNTWEIVGIYGINEAIYEEIRELIAVE